jgi:hypothetical protein
MSIIFQSSKSPKQPGAFASATRSTPTEQSHAAEAIIITIRATRRPDLFAMTKGSQVLVKSSRQPMCDAARALHKLGFPDDTFLTSRWEGSEIDSMRGLLGTWRKRRVRQGRNGPEFAAYEPFPCARVAKRKAKTNVRLKEGAGTQLKASSPPPGATEAAPSPAANIPPGDAPELIPNNHFQKTDPLSSKCGS